MAEFEYQPGKCQKSHRVVAVRKNITVEKGGDWLFDEIRYFFSITTLRQSSAAQIVQKANGRCDQENVIAQLKGAVNAMRMPVDNLESNWAYMVMTALAWNLKAWYGLMAGSGEEAARIVKMEFRTFTQGLIWAPAQIIRAGRKIIYPDVELQSMDRNDVCDVGTDAPPASLRDSYSQSAERKNLKGVFGGASLGQTQKG